MGTVLDNIDRLKQENQRDFTQSERYETLHDSALETLWKIGGEAVRGFELRYDRALRITSSSGVRAAPHDDRRYAVRELGPVHNEDPAGFDLAIHDDRGAALGLLMRVLPEVGDGLELSRTKVSFYFLAPGQGKVLSEFVDLTHSNKVERPYRTYGMGNVITLDEFGRALEGALRRRRILRFLKFWER